MAATVLVPAARSYPKRKRTQVSYHEVSSDEDEPDDNTDYVETVNSRKKPKTVTTATSSKALPKRKIFPFNSLPAELKNNIYAHALTDPNPIFLVSRLKAYRRIVKREVPSTGYSRGSLDWSRRRYIGAHQDSGSDSSDSASSSTLPALVPNLLALNHEVFREAQPILYANNAFVLQDTTALHNFLANIGPRNATVLADITIQGWGYAKAHKALNHPAFTLLAGAVNLHRLHLDCRISWDTRPERVATQVYRDGFHWMEAVGAAKGKFDAALEIIEVAKDNFSPGLYSGYQGLGKEPKPSHEQSMEVFRQELRKLLRRN